MDIDGFEEKPWRLQGIDVSDFFNFGMNEETWKDYCKQLVSDTKLHAHIPILTRAVQKVRGSRARSKIA